MVAIERHFDAKHLNAIINHEDVLPWVNASSQEPMDCTEYLRNPNVYALLGEYGGAVFQRMQVGLFEVHSQYVPEGRGEWALAATRLALHWIFTRTEATEILTRCPDGNIAARALARAIGGVKEFRSERGWVKDGNAIPADIYRLTIQDWLRTAPTLEEKGKWFHDKLEEELAKLDAHDEIHPDDPVHDRYVGAACEMFIGGQWGKAASVYNRFAHFCGYVPIKILSVEPLLIDIDTVILKITGDDFMVVHAKK